jgi:hypothetical protein
MGRTLNWSFFAIAVLRSTFGVASAQSNPQQAAQQRQAQERAAQQRRVEAGQREALEQAQRRIARGQAEQQREIEQGAEQRRRAEFNVARTLEREQREEERQALILRQQNAQIQENQHAEAGIPPSVPYPETRNSPTSSDAAEPEFNGAPWRLTGIGLMSSGILLALGRLVYLNFFNRSDGDVSNRLDR